MTKSWNLRDYLLGSPVWPDDEIKSCPIFSKIAQKEAKSYFIWRFVLLKIAIKITGIFGLLFIRIFFTMKLKIAQFGHTSYYLPACLPRLANKNGTSHKEFISGCKHWYRHDIKTSNSEPLMSDGPIQSKVKLFISSDYTVLLCMMEKQSSQPTTISVTWFG